MPKPRPSYPDWYNNSRGRDINLTSPFGHIKFANYKGRVPVWVIIGAWMAVVLTVTVWVCTLALGAVFGFFGVAGPSWMVTASLLFLLAILGTILRGD